MKQEKKVSLTKHLNDLKNRLAAPASEKHADHPESYKQFLEREIQVVTKKLESAKV